MDGHNSYTNVEVLRLVRAGLTDNGRIAARLGVARNTVCTIRRRYGIANLHGPARWDARARELGFADTAAAVRTWAAAGLTNGAMADRLDVWPAGCLAGATRALSARRHTPPRARPRPTRRTR